MKAIRVATICHNDDDCKDKNHRRVRLELHKNDIGYCWYTSDGEDTGTGSYKTVAEAQHAAKSVWGGEIWAMESKW